MWIWGLKGLKGICHEDIAILGQFCTEIMLLSPLPTPKMFL